MGIAGLGQELLGLLHVVGVDVGQRVVVVGRRGGEDAPGRLALAEEERVVDGDAVGGEVEGLADLHVGQGSRGLADGDEEVARVGEERAGLEVGQAFKAGMSLSGMPSTSTNPDSRELSCCGPGGNVDEGDAGEMDGLGVPVLRVLDQDDLLALDIALQHERPGADDVLVRVAPNSSRSAGP